MIKHYNITVTGKVQGVWYRKSTLEKAQQIGIKGFVKNLSNGSVYIEAEGTKEQLKKLLDWCAIGPDFSTVTDVSFEEMPNESFFDFNIKK